MDFPGFVPSVCKILPTNLLPALGPGPRPSEVLEVNQTYIAVYKEQNAIQDMRPDFSLLEQLHPYVVAVTAPGEDVDFVSRYYKPSYGMPEDSVTGSAHCALAPYWASRLGRAQLHASQLSEGGGEMWCEIAANREILKGNAVLIMQGFEVPDGESARESFAFQEFTCHVGRIAMLTIDRIVQPLHLFIGNFAR